VATGGQFKADLLERSPGPQRLAYLALHNDYSEDYCPDTDLSETRCGEIAVKRLLSGERGHYGPLEGPQLSLILRADHNTIMQLRTHRVGISFDVQSLRYTGERFEKVARGELHVDDVFYCRQPGTYRDRGGQPYEWTPARIATTKAHYIESCRRYLELRAYGVAEEQARGVIATNYLQNAVISANLRTWLHLLDVRLKLDAQLEIRAISELVEGFIADWVPEIYTWYARYRRGKAILSP
jgi:thymidylate synthase (FAD)